jgi:hypothetical protein
MRALFALVLVLATPTFACELDNMVGWTALADSGCEVRPFPELRGWSPL